MTGPGSLLLFGSDMLRVVLVLGAMAVVSGCSTCGSLASESGAAPASLAQAPDLRAPQGPAQSASGDVTRVQITGIVYWIERDGPPAEADATVRVINLAATRPQDRVLASQSVPLRSRSKPMRFAFALDADQLPRGASLGVEASVAGAAGGQVLFRTLAPQAIGPAGAQDLRLRLTRAAAQPAGG